MNSHEVCNAHWTVRCIVHQHTDEQVVTIPNNKQVNDFAVQMHLGILFWLSALILLA